MGMYTQLELHVEIKASAAKELENWIKFSQLASATSYLFADQGKSWIETDWTVHPDGTPPLTSLHISISLKNYEDEISGILKMISPHVVQGSSEPYMVGFIRYEENPYPTLIMIDNEWLELEDVNK